LNAVWYTAVMQKTKKKPSIIKTKDCLITIRIDSQTNAIIHRLAKKEDRPIAWAARTLITEALIKRKLLPK